MTHVEIDIEINRSAEEIFDYISNFENNPRWQSGMIEAHFTTNEPLAVGSTYVQVATFLGRRIESSFEVVAFEPGRTVTARSTSGPFPISFTRTVEPASGRARVRAVIEGDARGFFRLFGPLLNWMVRRSIEADYARLKRLQEGLG